MGSILRSGQFFKSMLCTRRFTSFKCAVPTCYRRKDLTKAECRNLRSYSSQQMQIVLPKVQTTFRQSRLAIPEIRNTLDRMLYKLDYDVRKNSRLSLKDVEMVLNEVHSLGKINSNQALLLIRCCGLLLPDEMLPVRNALTDRVWNTLTELGCQMDVSHYNALLRAYLDNENKFLPTDFLATMEEKGIEPNRVTYQRLVSKYCQDGDIVGASKILEFMKEQDMPISEVIFNSLVTGHAKARDLDGAREILNVMRNAQLDPTANTYCKLACGYAATGDISGLQQALKEAEENEVYLMDEDYLELIRELALNGHGQHVGEIIPKLQMKMGFNPLCMAIILELVNAGHEDIGFTLLKIMPCSTGPDGGTAPSGNFFISQLVRTDKPLDKILHYCQEMKALDLNPRALTKAVEVALANHKSDLALSLLQVMQLEGLPMRPHYFWPILIAARQIGEEAVYNVLRAMVEMDCQITNETFTDYALLGMNTADPEILIQRVKDLGMTVGSVLNPLIQYYLLHEKPSLAADLVEKYPVPLNSGLFTRLLALTCKETENVNYALRILKQIQENPEIVGVGTKRVTDVECCGEFLLDYLTQNGSQRDQLLPLVSQMKSMDFRISHSSMEQIQRLLLGTQNKEVIVSMLQSMLSSDAVTQLSQDIGIPHSNELSVEELESHLIELKSKGLNTRGVLRRLFLAHCRKRNHSQAMEVKAEMEELGMQFSPALYSSLMDLCVAKDRLEEALEYKTLVEAYPGFVIDYYKVLNLASLLVSKDRFEDAEKLLRSYKGKHQKSDDPESFSRSCSRVMNAAVEKGNVEQVNKLLELLIEGEYASVNSRMLVPLIKVHLVNNDIPGAVATFEKFSSLYKVTPCRNNLYKHLIDSEDSENLQKVLDISTGIHGEVNALHDLAGSFVECGRIKQARQIFATPGLRARQSRMVVICERFIDLNMTQGILNLIEATDNLFDVDQDMLYQYLIRAYAKENDVEKALSVWTTMQEKDIIPSSKTLHYLASFLKANNRPVPFNVPQPEAERKIYEGVTSSTSNIQKRARSGFMDENSIFEGKIGSQKKFVSQDRSLIIESLVKSDHLTEAVKLTEELLISGEYPKLSVFRFLLNHLVKVGDVASIQKLQPLIDEKTLAQLNFNNSLAAAFVSSDRFNELLDLWEADLANSKVNFPGGSFLRSLEKYPEHENRLLQLAERYATEENFFRPLNMIWMHWMLKEQFSKATEVCERLQGMTDRLLCRNVVNHATETRNTNISGKLYDMARKSTYNSRVKGYLIGCHLNVLASSGRSDEALQILQEQTSHGLTLDDFTTNCLTDLSTSLLAEGKSVPFDVPSPPRKAARDDTSSSSDDEK